MFNVKHNECVGFESRWKVTKVYSAASSQTGEISQAETATNTSTKREIEIQTDFVEVSKNTNTEVDDEKLANWLRKIMPNVRKELEKSQSAFKNYRLLEDMSDVRCRLLQTLKVCPYSGDFLQKVSALSWNSTGNTLGIACSFSHKIWCHHEEFVYFYTLNKDKFPDLPKIRLNVENCVVALKFHPELPAVVAAGTFSGGIIVWNIQHETEEIVVKISGHEERVTHLMWINDLNFAKRFLLVSSSLDGFLKLWKFNFGDFSLKLKERYKIKSPLLGKFQKSSVEPRKVVTGVVCFDFSKFMPDMFVAATEGGLVVQCSTSGTTELKSSKDQEPLSDPVAKYYEPHEGEINSINFSPNLKEMFMTCGSDGQIRVYLIDQEEPAKVIFVTQPLSCTVWIPFEEKIIAGGGVGGLIQIFDLIKGKLLENSIKGEKFETTNLTVMEICKNKTNLMAVGTDDGKLQLYDVPWYLFTAITKS